MSTNEPKPAPTILQCAGGWACCNRLVSMIGSKGYAYCGPCGLKRRASGYERVRKLKPNELRTLERGEPLARY